MAENIVGIKIEVGGKEQVVTSMGEIRKILKDLQFEQLRLTEQFGAGSKQAIEAAKRIEDLKDRIADAKNMTEAFNPDAKFKAFSQSLQGVVGGFAAVQGAMAVFGVESENLQKTLLRVQGALALSEGLNAFLDTGIQGFKNLASVIKSTFVALKAEIGLTGIGTLILGIAEGVNILYQNFDKLNGLTEEATGKNKAYKDSLDETNSATEDAIKNVNTVKQAFEGAKTGVISKKDALKIYNETLGDALGKTDNLAVAEKNLNSKAQAFITATMLKAQANAMFAQSAKLQAESLTTGQKDNVSWWEKSIAAVNSFFTNGILTYKTSVASYQAINTQEIKNGITKQTDILDKEGKKLLKQSEDIQRNAGIKLDVKADDNKEVKKEKTKQEKLQELLDEYKLNNKRRDENQLVELDEQLNKEVEANKKANEQIAADDAFARGEKLKGDTQVAKNKEALIEKEKALEKARFEESLKWATTYAESAQGLSDALYAAKLAGVEKGSKEEEAILRKQFETNKKIQIAQTIISGLNGVVNALSQKSVLPHPLSDIAKGINAAMIGATTAATVSKISQTQFGGTTTNFGGNAGGNAPMTPSVPIQQTVTTLNQGTINALGNQAIKAYVLESDVTNSQNRVTRILNSSRFK
jgi:hypothetical protein